MRILKPSEPCPCCGMPIRGDLPRWKLLLLSYIAEGLSLMDAINALAEVMELPPLGGGEVESAFASHVSPAAKHNPQSRPAAATALEVNWPAGPREAGLGRLPKEPLSAAAGTGAAEGEEKRAILQRLTEYRAAHGLGSLDTIAKATRTRGRITDNTLRMLLTGDAQLPVADWRKIGRALDRLEAVEQSNTEDKNEKKGC